jgi:hypothetical protein
MSSGLVASTLGEPLHRLPQRGRLQCRVRYSSSAVVSRPVAADDPTKTWRRTVTWAATDLSASDRRSGRRLARATRPAAAVAADLVRTLTMEPVVVSGRKLPS